MKVAILYIIAICTLTSCQESNKKTRDQNESFKSIKNSYTEEPSLVILGIAQDGGYPHPGCAKACCSRIFDQNQKAQKVVSIGLIDPENDISIMLEATPDFTYQNQLLQSHTKHNNSKMPDAIFITHAHIGHYTGLMYLGREALGAQGLPVYAMPRMVDFLFHNGPWDQLVNLKNITLHTIQDSVNIGVYTIKPLHVPHRDEYSETVGYIVRGPSKSMLFIPDIDKWEKWSHDIAQWIQKVDYAFLDATFYSGAELPGRDMSLIPHPSVKESLLLFKDLSNDDKSKIYWIHLNHTNPLLYKESDEYLHVDTLPYQVAEEGIVLIM